MKGKVRNTDSQWEECWRWEEWRLGVGVAACPVWSLAMALSMSVE